MRLNSRPFSSLSLLVPAVAFAVGLSGACSSSSSGGKDGGAGHGGSGGSKGGSGGSTAGTGGSGGSTGGSGGSAGAGGSAGGTGGSTGGAGGAAGHADGGLGGADGAAGNSGSDGAAGSDGSTNADLRTPDSAMSITTTSTALTAGGMFAAANTCAGANTSPPLTWTAGPSGTMSYAVVLIDASIGVAHWMIYDLPSTVMSLPASLPNDPTLTTPVAGKQSHYTPFFGATDAGYRGPCPSGALHTYRFEVHALDVATLPGVTASTPIATIYGTVVQHSLAHGDLTGMSNASPAPADASAGQ